uniref:Uncharacterized protein n=1 Tax=Brassica oleracea TaxID=3712 RepID=A0A3P6E0V3_BRAOL|nr:unnamed protein product [Brassica oleracea]
MRAPFFTMYTRIPSIMGLSLLLVPISTVLLYEPVRSSELIGLKSGNAPCIQDYGSSFSYPFHPHHHGVQGSAVNNTYLLFFR